MNKQSVKRRREEDDDDDDDGSEITIDRLSQLPQPILHQILSLLSQRDAVRTCVLSKSWRYLWHGRLNVEFHDNCFARKTEFWSFLDTTLQRYLDQNLSLQKFLLDIPSVVVDFELLQKWIYMVIMNMGVRSLSLIFPYPLPLVVFQSESLVELHLARCNLNTLKSTDNVIGLNSIKLHKHRNIKNFRCVAFRKIIIEIEDPQILENFHTEKRCSDRFLRHGNTHFPHLKSLILHSVQLPVSTFDNFSSFFPCLNELILENCDGLKEFRLLSSSIKRLTIKMYSINHRRGIKAFIDTPNIRYFEYSGHDFLPSIKFTPTFNEWKSKIFMWFKLEPSDNDAMSWFLKLNKLLKALSQSHITLSLAPNEYKKLHINDSYGGLYKPVVVDHLKLWGSYFYPAILNCFFRIFRPCYIQLDSGLGLGKYTEIPGLPNRKNPENTENSVYRKSRYGTRYVGIPTNSVRYRYENSVPKKGRYGIGIGENRRYTVPTQPYSGLARFNLAEYISKLIPNETDCYFWLQDLEEISTEVGNMEANEWHWVQTTSFPALLSQQQIRYRLTWKEQLSKFT
ncbi:hypothetical protein CASFOL_019871 [Castilleja foliolosa]|uniref:F-box domain-containing protein n=1 Tax=Castilleja foliolosa TaxID=1961234 RepID=A0ABD3D0J7_9LAMI